MRRVLFGLLGLSPQNCNLGLKTAICVAILKGFKKYHFENKTSTSQDNKLNFVFYFVQKILNGLQINAKEKVCSWMSCHHNSILGLKNIFASNYLECFEKRIVLKTKLAHLKIIN